LLKAVAKPVNTLIDINTKFSDFVNKERSWMCSDSPSVLLPCLSLLSKQEKEKAGAVN